MLQPLTDPTLDHPGITHGFFTRQGGVSYGRQDLNCGPKSDDNPAHIAENRARVGAYLGGHLEGVSQYHSAQVLTLCGTLHGALPPADALVTDRPGLALSVLSADCGPILFVDPKAGVIGAAHSGWKGTVERIAQRTVEAMEALGAHRQDICAVLGPTIAQASYEVGPSFPANIEQTGFEPARFLTPSTTDGHWMFDLPALIGAQLDELVGQARVMDQDTYTQEQLFFSYRRATHRAELGQGRQISGICLAR